MTRKHYKIIAAVIAATDMETKTKHVFVEQLCSEFKLMSALFNKVKFWDACMKEGK